MDHIPCELTGNSREDDHNGGKGPDPGQEGENMTYYVVAKKWDEEHEKQIEKIVGTFPLFHLAKLFQEAYEAEFKAHPRIYDEDELLN